MTIRNLFFGLFAATLVILVLVFASIYKIRASSAHLRDAFETRYKSYLLADELRQSSDDLTRLARTYVVTGDPRYEAQYNDVVAIRAGKKPRPAEYQRIYWDFVAAGDPQPRPPTKAVSLLELMKQAGFTSQELGKLSEAEANSNGLVKTETIAMNAVKGRFDDGTGSFTREGPPDLDMARRLLHDEAYHQTKARIMKPVDEFFVLLENRTASEVQRAEKANTFWNGVAIAAILCALLVLLAALYFVYQQIFKQLGNEPRVVAQAVERIAAGDLQSEIAARADDRSSLTHSLKVMQDSLRGIVRDIHMVVDDAATRGNFSTKMELAGRSGFMKEISELLNQLSSVTDAGLNDVMRVSGALANGDLGQTISQDYPGVFGETKDSVNNTVAALNELVADIRRMADASARGDFGQRIDLSGKRGFGADIGLLLNQISDVTESGLRDIMRVAQALARGDLTQSIDKDYPGLFGEARDGVNTTVVNLEMLVQQIKDAVDQISAAAREIALGNQDLSSRTEAQAASLEETASSMEELASTVKESESRVVKANGLVSEASDVATRSGEIVRSSVQMMADIADSSRRIAEIIGVIDGIAFQTNILALNAAVEAARAGEQGRGFAVVASEVRGLAQRSAEAAKDIKSLISDSVAKVESGTAQVYLAGESMDKIVSGIQGVTGIMQDIRGASSEQTAGIEQVALAVTQLDEVTQQNAALVEEAAAASQLLQGQAEGLMQSIAAFKLRNAEGRSTQVGID